MEKKVFIVICREDDFSDGHPIRVFESEVLANHFIVEQSKKDQENDYICWYKYHVQECILETKHHNYEN